MLIPFHVNSVGYIVSATNTADAQATTNNSTTALSFGTLSIGTADANRYIVVAVAGIENIQALSIAGTAMTKIGGSNGEQLWITSDRVAAGTTAAFTGTAQNTTNLWWYTISVFSVIVTAGHIPTKDVESSNNASGNYPLVSTTVSHQQNSVVFGSLLSTSTSEDNVRHSMAFAHKSAAGTATVAATAITSAGVTWDGDLTESYDTAPYQATSGNSYLYAVSLK